MAVEGVGAGSSRRTGRWTGRGSVRAAAAVLAVLLGLWLVPAGWRMVQDVVGTPDASEPSCSWSARIEKADADQAGLIRCYLRAVADRSDSGLRAVVPSADDDGPTGFTSADFAHSRDAAAGTATVTVAANAEDSADAEVTISYADGVRKVLEIHLANPGSLHSWRFLGIGTYPADPHAPTPAALPS